MGIHNRDCDALRRMQPEFADADSKISSERSAPPSQDSEIRPDEHRSIEGERMPLTLRRGMTESLANIIHSLVSSELKKMVERMHNSSLRRDDPLAIAELGPSEESLAQMLAGLNETVLHVGPLELDLIDRAAKRGDRHIYLRPREFQLLKYMMQRCDMVLTRATLLKEVWHYKFVPRTNLVDVQMGLLRRKVDGANEAPMIRNVRGVGFVLNATPLSQGPPKKNKNEVAVSREPMCEANSNSASDKLQPYAKEKPPWLAPTIFEKCTH